MTIVKSRDLALVGIVSIAAMIVAAAGLTSTALGVILGVPFVLLCPGYAVSAALPFPSQLGAIEKVIFVLGLSLAITALGGIMLTTTAWGLQTTPWAVLLGAVTLLACAVAERRRNSVPGHITLRLRVNAREGIFGSLAVLITVAALTVARVGAIDQPVSGFTQLWLLPNGQGSANAVRIGIHSAESRTTTYRLAMTAGHRTIMQRPSLTLHPGQTWHVTVVLPRNLPARIDGLLYRDSKPHAIYRHVTLWYRKA